MITYEYIQVRYDWGDLRQLNALASNGWRVAYGSDKYSDGAVMLLLERPITDPEQQARTRKYYMDLGGKP